MSAARDTDPDAEREVDLRSAWTRITARWWLPVAGLVIGAILGVLVSVGGGEVFQATTLLYLGQPFTTSGGGQIQSLATNPKTVNRIIRSEAALQTCGAVSGLTVGQLRGNVSSAAIVTAGQGKNVSPLVEITVKAPTGRQAAAGVGLARELGRRRRLGLRRPEDRAAERADRREQGRARGRSTRGSRAAVKQQQAILADKSLSSTDKLIAVSISNNTISFSEQRRGTVQQELFQNQQLLSLAENVEMSKIVQPARRAPRRRRRAAATPPRSAG